MQSRIPAQGKRAATGCGKTAHTDADLHHHSAQSTVAVHKNNLFRKLGVGNTVELLRYMQKIGL